MYKSAALLRNGITTLLAAFLMLLLLENSPVFGECKTKLLPSFSVSETYNDNILLRPINKISDFLTGISPAVAVNADCLTKGFSLAYSPTFVIYQRYTNYNTVRHNANLAAFYQMGAYTRFDLTDSFYRTDEPIEPNPLVFENRRNRSPYYRNSGIVKITRQIGAKDNIFAGYDDNHLSNEDPSVEDVRLQTPFAGISYWFDVKNSLEFNLRYTVSDYQRSPDLKQTQGTLAYTHLFTQQTNIMASYSYTDVNYHAGGNDNTINSGNVTYNTTLWKDYTAGIGVGYYAYNPKTGSSNSEFSYTLSLGRQPIKLERGTLTFGFQSGYRQDYSDAQNPGFVTFWSAQSNIVYFITMNLSLNGGLNYREDRFRQQSNRLDKVFAANAGLVYDYGRWLVFSFSGQYFQRDSTFGLENYDNSQIILTATLRDKLP